MTEYWYGFIMGFILWIFFMPFLACVLTALGFDWYHVSRKHLKAQRMRRKMVKVANGKKPPKSWPRSP